MRAARALSFVVALMAPCLANATIIGFGPTADGTNDCTSGAVNACLIAPDQAPIPNPVARNPNDGILLVWNEVQNFTLTQDLRVDRVADDSLPFVTADGSDFLIAAGTIVSSHYIQWDPGNGSEGRVDTALLFDSDIFAFITADQNLFDSDFLGVPGIDYDDFGNRGIEGGDTTVFGADLTQVDISWRASSPGDWDRIITAFSPAAPEPASILMLLAGLGALGLVNRRH